jgi:hypothetical protein
MRHAETPPSSYYRHGIFDISDNRYLTITFVVQQGALLYECFINKVKGPN